MSAFSKVAPPEPPAPRRRQPARLEPVDDAPDAGKVAKTSELARELKAIGLILFGLFLAGALLAVGLSTATAGFNPSGSVGFIGRILVEPLVYLFGWPAAILTPLVPIVHS